MTTEKFNIKKHVSTKLSLESNCDLKRRAGITKYLHKCGYISDPLFEHIMDIIKNRLGDQF